jgi:hypothetical protein
MNKSSKFRIALATAVFGEVRTNRTATKISSRGNFCVTLMDIESKIVRFCTNTQIFEITDAVITCVLASD